MHDAVGVRKREGAADLEAELDCLPHRQRPRPRDEVLQVLALDMLEDDVLHAVGLAPIDHRDDVRMVELRHRTRLAPEAVDVALVVGEALVEDLDRNAAPELAVAGHVDARHASGAGQLFEFVPSGDQLTDHAL